MSDEIKPLYFDDLEDDNNNQSSQTYGSSNFEQISSSNMDDSKGSNFDTYENQEKLYDSEVDTTFKPRVRKPNSITNKDSNFVAFFGTAQSGKSVILSSMLYAMQTKYGVLSPKKGTPNSHDADVLLETFFEKISQGYLPERTDRDQVTRMDLVFKPNNKSAKVPPIDLTFLEISGENWNDIKKGGQWLKDIDTYITAPIPLTFILVTGYNNAHTEDTIIKTFLYHLEKKRKSTWKTNVLLVVSKWDQSGSETVNNSQELENFISERLPMTYNYLKTNKLDKTYFTIGELEKIDGIHEDKERIKYLNLTSAERLSRWLYKSIAQKDINYQGTFWEQIKWSIGLK